MAGCVYLLPHISEKRFKIGKSKSLVARIRELGGGAVFDVNSSMAFYTEKYSELERILHIMFDSARLNLDPTSDGYTEWFDKNSWDDVTAFIEQHKERIGITRVEKSLRHIYRREAQSRSPLYPIKLSKHDLDADIVSFHEHSQQYLKTLDYYLKSGAVVGYIEIIDDSHSITHETPRGYLFVRHLPLNPESGTPRELEDVCAASKDIMNSGNFYQRQDPKSLYVRIHHVMYSCSNAGMSIIGTEMPDEPLFGSSRYISGRTFESIAAKIREYFESNIPGYSRVEINENDRSALADFLIETLENIKSGGIFSRVIDQKTCEKMFLVLERSSTNVSAAASPYPTP